MSEYPCSQSQDGDDLIEVRATVVAIQDEWADVKPDAQGCGRCHEPGGCGGRSLTQMLSPNKTYRIHNAIQARVGDRVFIQGQPDMVRKAAWQAYVLPLLACLLGAALGQGLGQDQGAMLGGAGGLLLGWWQLAAKKRATSGASLQMRHDVS